MHSPLVGPWIPLPLPFEDGGAVDLDRLARSVDAWMREPVSGFATCTSDGSPGEFADLAFDEWRVAVEQIAARTGKVGFPLVIACAHPEGEAARRLEYAAHLDVAGLLVSTPGQDDEDLAQVQDLAGCAAGTPILLVEPPGARSFRATWVRDSLQRVPGLAGLVLTGRGEDGLEELREFEEDLALWVPDTELVTGYRRGAVGSLSAHSLWDAGSCARWFDALHDDLDAALAFERRWVRFWELFVTPLRRRHALTRAGVDKLLALAGGVFRGAPTMGWPNASPDPRWAEELRAAGEHAIFPT
ncbi:MAG: hypothetical protein O2816_09645 [Planctomycetota bacterium]|nr:hypothetical protein [Planctomycetota bacterium]